MDPAVKGGRLRAVGLAWAVYVALAPTLVAQQAMFRNYTVEDGLSQSQIETILQDNQGQLWSGTYHGLSRFDGHTFTNFTVKDGLADNIVTASHMDATGRLWFGHPSGNVTTYSDATFDVLPAAEAWQGRQIQGFLDDAAGTLWIATEGSGLLAMKMGVSNLPVALPQSPRRVRDVVAWADRLWVGAAEGLFSFAPVDDATAARFDTPTTSFVHDVLALAVDAAGKLWIGTSDSGFSSSSLAVGWSSTSPSGATFDGGGVTTGGSTSTTGSRASGRASVFA